jgi:hypothetical protein
VGVYLLFFTMVGLITVGVGTTVYTINRLLTKLRHPPRFNGMTLFWIIAEGPAAGCLLASFPLFLSWIFVKGYFHPYNVESPWNWCADRPAGLPRAALPLPLALALGPPPGGDVRVVENVSQPS